LRGKRKKRGRHNEGGNWGKGKERTLEKKALILFPGESRKNEGGEKPFSGAREKKPMCQFSMEKKKKGDVRFGPKKGEKKDFQITVKGKGSKIPTQRRRHPKRERKKKYREFGREKTEKKTGVQRTEKKKESAA